MNDRWRRFFRGLLVAVWGLTLLGTWGSVPAELQQVANDSYARDPRPFRLFLGIACSFGLLKTLVEVGLFLFRGWARPMFAILAVLGVAGPFAITLLPVELASVRDGPLEHSFATLLSMADGAILALVYASPVAALFEGPRMQAPTGAGVAG